MSIVTITLNNKNFQLACNDGEEEALNSLAVSLDKKLAEIKRTNLSASFELLLVMSALSLQDQVNNLTFKIGKLSKDDLSEKDEKLAETLITIAGYLENIAQKLGK